MKLARLNYAPSALIGFFEEGLGALGAICERSWHDRLQLVAEGPAARLWNPEGSLLETELRFVPPEDAAPRQADREVFPGCPLTFRLAESLRSTPLTLERGVLQPLESLRAPTAEVAEKLWQAQKPGCSRWKLERVPVAGWHFSLAALARCEIQAIDQHWTLHRLVLSLPDGEADPALAAQFDFLQLSSSHPQLPWPRIELDPWSNLLRTAFERELQADLVAIRARQQKYLQRELERIDSYFTAYEQELLQRERRSHAESTRIKTHERLQAAQTEHARRRQDQIQRHEIRVMVHLDALLLLAEPAWEAPVSFLQKGESKTAQAVFVPRSRRWICQGASSA